MNHQTGCLQRMDALSRLQIPWATVGECFGVADGIDNILPKKARPTGLHAPQVTVRCGGHCSATVDQLCCNRTIAAYLSTFSSLDRSHGFQISMVVTLFRVSRN